MEINCNEIIEKFLAEEQSNGDYLRFHGKRLTRSLEIVQEYLPQRTESALEVGAIGLFAHTLVAEFGFRECDVTIYDPQQRDPIVPFTVRHSGEAIQFRGFNINLEAAPIPVPDGTYDLVLSFEVLEHMAVDPMYHMAELNRTMRLGGTIILSTPNITSARSLKFMLDGWHPHFYCAYNLNHSHDRHNLEYSPQLLQAIFTAAGFEVRRLWSEDLFNEPLPDILDFLRVSGYPTDNRGDDLLCIATKVDGVRDRYPSLLYA